MNTQRVMAIFEKDMKDFTKNTMVMFTPIMPILLATLYSRFNDGVDGVSYELIYIIIGITFSTVSTGLMMMIMAEEKEKNTLRGLMMSPASFVDIIVGKSLVTTLLTVVTFVISFLIFDPSSLVDFSVILSSLLLFVFFLLLGVGVGLFVKSVGTTTIYTLPIMLIFGFTTMFSMLGLEEDHIVIKITDWFPLIAAMEYSATDNSSAIFVMLAWIVAAGIFVVVCFMKTSKDR